MPGLEPPDGNPFHALIGVHPEEEEKESDEEEEDLEEDMEEEEEDGDEEIHVTWRVTEPNVSCDPSYQPNISSPMLVKISFL